MFIQPTENPATPERHNISFTLAYITTYLSQIMVNVHKDFTLGWKIVCAFFSETFVFLWL